MAEEHKIWVELLNYDNTLYAKSMLPKNVHEGLQKVRDSSRGYALRLTSDDGRTMWIGLGFHDRNDAFDFNETFKDFIRQRDYELNDAKNPVRNVDMSQYALKPGQKLVIGGGDDSGNDTGFGSGGFGGGDFSDPFKTKVTGLAQKDDPFAKFKISGPDDDKPEDNDIWGGFGTSNNQGGGDKFNLLDDNFFVGPQQNKAGNTEVVQEENLLGNPFENNKQSNNDNGFGFGNTGNSGGNPFGGDDNQEVDLLGM